MAFKPLSLKEGFSAMSHLDADTIRFAQLLRNGPESDDDDFMKGLSEEERKILEEENKRKRAEARQKPCTNKDCKQTEASVSFCIIERVTILKTLERMEATLSENLEEYEILQQQSSANTIEADALQQTLQALQHRENKELKEQVAALNKSKTQLEVAIAKAQQEIDELVRAQSGAAEAESAASSSSGGGVKGGLGPGASSAPHRPNLPQINFAPNAAPAVPRIHTGVYRTVGTGRKMWSCCMNEDEEAGGCADNLAGQEMEAFVSKHKESYRPYTVSQAHWKAIHDEKLAALHRPVSGPAYMNKGHRDTRKDNLLYNFFPKSFSPSSSSVSHAGGHSLSLSQSLVSSPVSRQRSQPSSTNTLSPARSSLKPGSSPVIHAHSAPSSSSSSPSPSLSHPSGVRPATVGNHGDRDKSRGFSPSVSFLLPGATNTSAGADLPSPVRSPSLTRRGYSGSLYDSTISVPPAGLGPSHFSNSLTAPISSLLPPSNANVTTFGGGHAPPLIPSYIKVPAVQPGWETSHTRGLDGGSFFFAADRATGMTTNQQFQSSVRSSCHTPYTRPDSPNVWQGASSGSGSGSNSKSHSPAKSPNAAPSPLKYLSSPGKKGHVRTVGDVSIKRIGGRPLTSPWGPHLSLSSTVAPSTDLVHISQRIV